jgi:hypothetical protein
MAYSSAGPYYQAAQAIPWIPIPYANCELTHLFFGASFIGALNVQQKNRRFAISVIIYRFSSNVPFFVDYPLSGAKCRSRHFALAV